MNNDIQKYRYLIETIILDESFKDAERIFTDTNGNQKEVSSYIELFKELAKRNKIQGMEKDISRWIKVGWDDFKKFVDSKKEVQSKREVQSIQKKDSIQVYKDEDKVVVIPLTKEASIHYGKNTKWCTSATESKNHFIEYFYIDVITLFYVLLKNGDKYACAFNASQPDTKECFDQLDNSISFNEFRKVTGVSDSEIRKWYSSNKGVIMKTQDVNNLPEQDQIELVKERVDVIRVIDNPSEQVQLAAVKQSKYAIEHIDNLSEVVQLAAVKEDAYAIEHIVKKGIEPSETIQLAAVQNRGAAIFYIDNPSEAVQLAAVKENGMAIRHIIDKGISPSEVVQLAAVQQSKYAIEDIKNSSEKVKALHNKLYK